MESAVVLGIEVVLDDNVLLLAVVYTAFHIPVDDYVPAELTLRGDSKGGIDILTFLIGGKDGEGGIWFLPRAIQCEG